MNLSTHPQLNIESPSVADLGEEEFLPPATLSLSVVIVNYNVRDFLKQALASVERAVAELDAEVIVVDNNSADGSVEMIETDFPSVTVIRNKENIGFSKANNQALRISRGEFILLLNPDTIVSEDTLTVLVDFLKDRPGAGAVGCQILHPNGSFARESRRAFPTPMVAFFRIAGLSTLFPKSRLFGRYNMSYLPVDQVAEVDALSGSCMMVRRESLLTSGPFKSPGATDERPTDLPRLLDEEFFMYGEDLDWCYRIQQAGWKIMYTPDTKIIHYKGESTRKGELRYVKLFYGAMVRFSRKHFHGYGKLVVELLRVAIIFKAILSVLVRFTSAVFPAAVDFAVVYASVVGAALLRSLALPGDLFLITVAPAFAAVTIFGIAISGGYRNRQRNFRSAVAGLLLALLVVSAASFFVPQIAFSRLIILMSVPIAGLLLALIRLTMRYKASSISRTVLIGSPEDERQFSHIITNNPNPSLEYVGIVPIGDFETRSAEVNVLGRLDQLRDIVRVRDIDTIVIASGALPNYRIFAIIQELRDLPVTFKMLTDTYDRTIGKASIDDLSTPRMVAIDQVLPKPRSSFEKRSFEIAVALAGIILYPVGLAMTRGNFSVTNQRTAKLFRVLTGRLPLIGMDPSDRLLADNELPLSEGAFSIVDALPDVLDAEGRLNAYHFYLSNESAQLDWDIMMRTIRSKK